MPDDRKEFAPAPEVPGMKLIGYVNIYGAGVHGGIYDNPQDCFDGVPRKYHDRPGLATPVYVPMT